jgi:hypothetical protein
MHHIDHENISYIEHKVILNLGYVTETGWEDERSVGSKTAKEFV